MNRALTLLALMGCPLPPPTVDIAAPKVLTLDPPDQAVDVPIGVAMQVCFDSPLRAASVSSAGVALSRADGHVTRAVAVSLGLDASATCLAIVPVAFLSPASHYQLTLRSTLLGANGVALGDSKKADAYVATFATVGPAATGVLLMPADGTLTAPLDLSQVVVAFDAPVTIAGDGGPFSISWSGSSLPSLPGGAPSTLSADGRLATSAFSGAPAGAQIQLTLTPGLTDPSGQTPQTGGPLSFTMGSCSEGSVPSVGEGVVVARDVDAWLQFSTDRPGLCGASVQDPGSASAGALGATAAVCNGPYDACSPDLFCLCTVPLSSLGPGDAVEVTPQLTGDDGLVGMGPPTTFGTYSPLPSLVLTEVFPGAKTTAFVELQNRGPGPLDLSNLQLADCALSLGCASPKTPVAFGPLGGVGSATLPADGYALLVDATFDASAAPPDAVLLSPLYGVSMVHLSTTGLQSLAVFLPGSAAPVSTYDGSVLPKTGLSLERVNPGATDATPGDWAVSMVQGGTQGACNSVTPGTDCDP